jgi:hypothetical protein
VRCTRALVTAGVATGSATCARGRGVEHEYERMGLCYMDAWDVRRGRVIGRSEPKGALSPIGPAL